MYNATCYDVKGNTLLRRKNCGVRECKKIVLRKKNQLNFV